jgi:methyl-galactoside transport system substrate-binding protein
MKKLIAILLTLSFLTALLSGCARKNEDADVHVFYYTYSDPYISSVRSALDNRLKSAGIAFQDYDGNGNQTTQTEQVQTAITKGAKCVIVNIVNTGSDDAANGIVQLAKNANIPVIFFNREVSTAVVDSYEKCAFVGTDAAEAGHLQGEMIGEYLLKHKDTVDLNKDGEISYILFKGEEGNNEAIYRTQYAVEDANRILNKNGLKPLKFYDPSNTNRYLVDKNGQWSAAAANEYMTTALTSFSESKNNMIELVICNNDNMAEGAVSALNNAGYNKGVGTKMIPVFGVDATDAAKELIRDGKMSGTIKQDAAGMAEALLKLADNGLKGAPLMQGTEDYHVDEGTDKIRIAYDKYLGE